MCQIVVYGPTVETTRQRDVHALDLLIPDLSTLPRKVDIRLSGKGNSNSHGAGPVYYNHHGDVVDSDQ